MFVILGTFIFYGSGEELPNNNSDFAHKVVTMYLLRQLVIGVTS